MGGNLLRQYLFTLASWLVPLIGCPSHAAAEIPKATDAPAALSPEESQKRFRLPDDLRIELVAAEPHLAEPTAMCFDARGRIFVCELHGYNRDGYYDIVELNKTGKLDTKIRRIPASKEAEARAAKETYGTVKLLEDTDGDGRVDRMTVFADRLPPCYGVIAAREGIIALCAPDIYFLADRDGDGKAEVREKLFTGFGVGELWTRISNPRWGSNNWIYAASGASSRGTIRGPRLKKEVQLGNTCFRFKPDGTALEPISGGTSGYGLALDDWGDRFLCTNQQHALYVAPLPYHDLVRNPFVPTVNPVLNICTYGHPARVHPTSQPDPWRRKRGAQAEWVKFYGSAETNAGLFTSACAPLVYEADLLPARYFGNHFSCEPAQNLIHRCLLEPKGAGFAARRADEGRDFLTSTDSWFRPVNLTIGPEGALYIVDMYREIIEDYSAIPRYLQQQYVEGLINGKDRGRIWRIVPRESPKPRPANLAAASQAEQVAELASGNPWRRLTAQRLLVERGEPKTVALLKAMSERRITPQARLHVLNSLDGLQALDPQMVERALGDPHHGVRVHALRLAERWLEKEPTLLRRSLSLVDDPHPKVRLQLALSLGASQDVKTLDTLAHLAEREGENDWMRAAILTAVPTRAAKLSEILVSRAGRNERSARLLGPLASVVGARNEPDDIAVLLRLVARLRGADAAAIPMRILLGLEEGLARNRSRKALSAEEQRALEELLRVSSDEAKAHVLRVASLLGLRDSQGVRAVRAAALKTALDSERPLAERTATLSLLTGVETAELEKVRGLLHPRQPIALQIAAVAALTSDDKPEIVTFLLKDWDAYSPRMQEAILSAVFSRQDRLPLLLDSIEKKILQPSSLPPLRQTQMLENPNSAIRERAKELLASRATSSDRKQVLDRYRESLTLKRDVRRGEKVFELQCMKCHQLNGRGFAVGPDLAAVQNRPDESLLIDILDPSSTITAGYRAYLVVTQNGKAYTGTLAAETATSITLRREKGEQDVLLRRDIDQMTACSKSLMPEGIEKEINPQDMANLMGYLRETLKSATKKVVLFDDEPEFVAALNEGEGKAELTSASAFSGSACLRVTPPQRFSPRIAGWNYRIVEKPGPGEFRYLRFAWKGPEAKGIMLELADKGAWPDAGAPRCRVYSGDNTTPWKALRLSKDVPRDWVVVTVDLWGRFGEMTLTGLAPTAMGGPVYFDRIELLQSTEETGSRTTGSK
jgi:putative membrane-bound dehydrogenase-like protein